jgi:hypothetical protein
MMLLQQLERCIQWKSSESEIHGLGKLYLCSRASLKIQGYSLESRRPIPLYPIDIHEI